MGKVEEKGGRVGSKGSGPHGRSEVEAAENGPGASPKPHRRTCPGDTLLNMPFLGGLITETTHVEEEGPSP